MHHPSFSVVIPTYQRREVVCAALRALGDVQYDGEVEVIVVVDGSTDGTVEALATVPCPFPIRIIEQDNRGASSARNRGAAEAKGQVVLFIDDDMICDPDLLEQHAQMYRDGADAVIGETPTHPDSAPGFLSESVRRWIEGEQVSSPLSHWDIFTGQLSVRKPVFDAVGGFDEDYTSGDSFANEDADIGVRLLSRFDVRHNPLAVTRQRYVVTPRQYMARAPKALQADLHFLRKHPQFSQQVFEARGSKSALARYAYLPLSGIPLVRSALPALATATAEMALKTPFRSNRLVARFFSGSRWVAYWTAFRRQSALPGTERLLVLGYHAIQDQSEDPILFPYGVPPDEFARQLDLLTGAGFTFVTADAVANFICHGAPLPKRPVLLTFDDCYRELLQVAREVLRPRNIGAIAFAVTAMKSGTNEWDQEVGAERLTLLSPHDLGELAGLGVEIGSHSRTHREMTLLEPGQQEDEASGSADDLAEMGLPRPRFFAYPYGAIDEPCRKAVEAAGYLAAFSCIPRLMTRRSDPFSLPRVVIRAPDRGWQFRIKVRAPRLHSHAVRWRERARSAPRKIMERIRGAH